MVSIGKLVMGVMLITVALLTDAFGFVFDDILLVPWGIIMIAQGLFGEAPPYGVIKYK